MGERRRIAITGGILAILLGALELPCAAHAGGVGGKMVIAPTRIVLEGGERSATIHIGNHRDTPATLRISVVNKRMLDSGLIIDADEPEPAETFAKELIRFAPRRLVMAPNQTQTVRLLVRKPAGRELPPGEYRSHLVFRSVPTLPPEVDNEPEEETGDIRVSAHAIIEISIPIIYRVGDPEASVKFATSEIRVESDPGATPTLTLRLEREGKRSVYGDLAVDYIRPDLSSRQVAFLGGVAVYHPTPSRLFRIGLQLPDGMRLEGGELRAHFRERNLDDGGAETRITIPLD